MNEDIIQKVEQGDPLTNNELYKAIAFYEQMEKGLDLLGDKFYHARQAVSNVVSTLRGYADAREVIPHR